MHFSLRLFIVVSATLKVNILHPHEVWGLRSNLWDHPENGGRLRGRGGDLKKGQNQQFLRKMKVRQQCIPVVMFLVLYKVILTFDSVTEIFKFAHSNKSYWALLSCGLVYYAVQGGSNYWVHSWNYYVWLVKVRQMAQVWFLVVNFNSQSFKNIIVVRLWPWEWR